jgi:hypothetical protein
MQMQCFSLVSLANNQKSKAEAEAEAEAKTVYKSATVCSHAMTLV